jgi:hypothetical protein
LWYPESHGYLSYSHRRGAEMSVEGTPYPNWGRDAVHRFSGLKY